MADDHDRDTEHTTIVERDGGGGGDPDGNAQNGATLLGKMLRLDVQGDDLRRGLAQLQAAEFVYESRLFPELEYAFKHAVIQEVVYRQVSLGRRRALHGQLVDAIERALPASTVRSMEVRSPEQEI